MQKLLPLDPKIRNAVIQAILQRPDLSYINIAKLCGCSEWSVNHIAVVENIRRPRGTASPAHRGYKHNPGGPGQSGPNGQV